MTRARRTLAAIAATLGTSLGFIGVMAVGPVSSASAATCATAAYVPSGTQWPTPTADTYYTSLDVNWPGGINGRNAVLSGQLAWNYTTDACGAPDTSPYAAWWGGGTSGWSAGTQDTVDYRDFGSVAAIGCAGSLACAPYWFNGFGYIVEADQRFSNAGSISWYTGGGTPGAFQYDLYGVGTHESGHSLGLAHVGNIPKQVMHPTADPGSTWWRTLGWGDYTGMQALYP